jgi:mono/diheme cytochrome c family protein
MEAHMFKLLFALPAALLFGFLPQEPTAPAAAPAQAPSAAAATLTNPVHPTSDSQAHAKSTFAMDCAICHGENGNGKGELVADMQLKMKDFTDPSILKDKSDGEIFTMIKNGDDKLKMPAEGPRAKDEAIWNLVIYLRSLAK